MASSLMMAGIIRSEAKDLKKKCVRFTLPENLLYLQDRCGENGNRSDDRSIWLSPISGAYYDWLQKNAGKALQPSLQTESSIDMLYKEELNTGDYQDINLQLSGSPTESMQEIGSLASDATFIVSPSQTCTQCKRLEQTTKEISKENEDLSQKLKKSEEEINSLKNNIHKLEENLKEVESYNRVTLQRVQFLENSLSRGQADQAQLQVKLAESRAKLSMLLNGKDCLVNKRLKTQERKEIDAEETKAQMDMLRSEIERLTVSSSRVDVLSSTIQVYKDRITELQKVVDANMKRRCIDAEVQVGYNRSFDRLSKDKTRIPKLIRNNQTNNGKLLADTKPSIGGENLITRLRNIVCKLRYEKEELEEKLNHIQLNEKLSNEKFEEKEQEITTLQKKNVTLMENYHKEMVLRKKLYNLLEIIKGRVRVYCRIRPLNSSEIQNSTCSVKTIDKYTVVVQTSKGYKEYQFDGVFSPHNTQEDVFKDTEDLIQSVIDGYNVCLFGYGQTGSGKTYTLIGTKDEPGLAVKSFYKVFDLIKENNSGLEFSVSSSILELYNDNLIDLLKTKNLPENQDKLEIKKPQNGHVYVQGATKVTVANMNQLMALFHNACNNRHTSATKMNLSSSRSHLIVSISVESNNLLTGTVLTGKFSVIDLAGSERIGKSAAVANQLKEANSINRSLSALADVIAALITDQSHIPYRNNKLTQLMQDSLGGNSKTLMFVNISPAECNLDETLSSLAYASRVKQITNEALKNQVKMKKSPTRT